MSCGSIFSSCFRCFKAKEEKNTAPAGLVIKINEKIVDELNSSFDPVHQAKHRPINFECESLDRRLIKNGFLALAKMRTETFWAKMQMNAMSSFSKPFHYFSAPEHFSQLESSEESKLSSWAAVGHKGGKDEWEDR